jgi:hypothetical protein
MTDDRNSPPEQPRYEPEIIPPDRGGRRSDWGGMPWRSGGYYQARGTQRLYVTRLGPFGFALLMLAIGAIAAVIVVTILGTLLIWIPLVAVFVLIAAFFRFFRR